VLILRAFDSTKTFDANLSSIARTEIVVDYDELRKYIRQKFEKKFKNSVVDVKAAKHSPYTIDAVIYVKEEKNGMWGLCIDIADMIRSQGIPIGIHTELAEGTSE
jgi:hypothetical protein